MPEPPADLYWDAEDPDECGHDIDTILDNYSYGEIVEVQRAALLPNAYGVRLEDGRVCEFATYKEAEEWLLANPPPSEDKDDAGFT